MHFESLDQQTATSIQQPATHFLSPSSFVLRPLSLVLRPSSLVLRPSVLPIPPSFLNGLVEAFLTETFEQRGFAGRHAGEGLGRTVAGDGAFIAVLAAVVPYLELKRAIAEGAAAFHAFAAAYAEFLFDMVFKERIFDEFAFDGVSWAKLVFGACVQGFGAGFEISPA
jgi:hypothetical protein